ncbi:hypothetical protein I302_106494 [Kwoniella bestiolae CBS 10118]|uniref:F-box domain-containing protein n=1 Tax=Kwoniella bestiolae CBS 10118 TaxID=1296100 RepID=A0A1B9G189_9TREE|nr:hypothetical protein I302_06248 [Kwoniella bestiolae CBS 10118]OCF24787.1 hypothetical protein I302_06248 [Kwoniella bestiolae CBS 10118]
MPDLNPHSHSLISPALPDDLLFEILDSICKNDFNFLKTAVLIDTQVYQRYAPRLYKHIRLDWRNSCNLASHAEAIFENRASLDITQRKREERFKEFCRNVTHLTLTDQESGVAFAKSLSTIPVPAWHFLNLDYLTLGDDFMRFLQRFDYKYNSEGVNSRKMVKLLGKHLHPAHLCIDTLREFDKKDSKSPEVWKLRMMLEDWRLKFITFYNDTGSTRVILENVANQRFFVESGEGSSTFALMGNPMVYEYGRQAMIEILSSSAGHTVSRGGLPSRMSTCVKLKQEGSACVCCGKR